MIDIRKEVPIEAANRMYLVDLYHEPLWRAFSILREECPDLSFDEVLLSDMKSTNGSTGTDGLIPTILVFCAMLRLGTRHDPTHFEILKRANIVAKETKAMFYYFIKSQLRDERQQRNGRDVTDDRGTSLGTHALVT